MTFDCSNGCNFCVIRWEFKVPLSTQCFTWQIKHDLIVWCWWIKMLKQLNTCPVKMVFRSTRTDVVINIINSFSSERRVSPIGRTSPFVWYYRHTWSLIADCISSALLYGILKPSADTLSIILFFCVRDCYRKPVKMEKDSNLERSMTHIDDHLIPLSFESIELDELR